MSLRHPMALLAFAALSACGPEFELAPTDTLDRVESSMETQACTTTRQILANRGFESGNVVWQAQKTNAFLIANIPSQARTGNWRANFQVNALNTNGLKQQVTIPTTTCTGALTFWLKISSTETTTDNPDVMRVFLRDGTGFLLETLLQFDSRQAGATYVKRTIPLTFNRANYRGQPIYVEFTTQGNTQAGTQFFVDDTALTITE